MKFTRELTGSLTIQSVTPQAIIVNGDTYNQSIALTPREILVGWAPTPIDELVADNLDDLLRCSPEIVLLGTGQRSVFPPRELMFAFARRGVGLEFMDTAAAARTFNVLATEGRQIAAALYL